MYSEKGQTLLELLAVISVMVIVVTALVFATISSLRNSQFAQNQNQATKLSQEGLEKLRSLRDRNLPGSVDYTKADSTHTSSFSDLWPITFTCPTSCYFFLNSGNTTLTGGTATNFETVSTIFKRQFQIEDVPGLGATQKKVTSTVQWTDYSGTHQSVLTTILRKL